MRETLGARLRQRREEQQIDLRTIAEQTKIKLSLLEGLERDDVSHWPSGIYRRAYVRAYAKSIGIDPDLVVREFTEAHPDADELFASAAEALANAARADAGPPTRLRSIVGSALGSLTRFRRPLASEGLAVGACTDDTDELPVPVPPARAEVTPPTEAPAAVDGPDSVSMLVAEAPPPPAPAVPEPDFTVLAHLCTEIGRVASAEELKPLLTDAACLLDARGIIVWVWDPAVNGLRAVMVYGYPERLIAKLPPVRRDADNATAEAFRSMQVCAVSGSEDATAALVVPLLTAGGCTGVLAFELPHVRDPLPSVRAAATMLAAVLAQLTARAEPAAVDPAADLMVPAAVHVR